MKSRLGLLAAAIVIFTLVFAGCSDGDSHEKVADDMGMQMDRMATAMSAVTDKASAEKAVADMRTITGEIKKIAARAKVLGSPSAEVRAKVEAKMKAKADELQTKMAGSQATLMKAGPEAAGILMKGMMELAPVMNEMGDLFKDADRK